MPFRHIQHTEICFDDFVVSPHRLLNEDISSNQSQSRATENARVPVATKAAIKDWLFDLQSQIETSVSGGKKFSNGVHRGMFKATREKETELTVDGTCLFMTLPYLLLSEGRFPRKGGKWHPVRALVESFYRNGSPFSREFGQAVNRLEPSSVDKVIYVPQVWCLLINDGTLPYGISD